MLQLVRVAVRVAVPSRLGCRLDVRAWVGVVRARVGVVYARLSVDPCLWTVSTMTILFSSGLSHIGLITSAHRGGDMVECGLFLCARTHRIDSQGFAVLLQKLQQLWLVSIRLVYGTRRRGIHAHTSDR